MVTFPLHIPAASGRPGHISDKDVSGTCSEFESTRWLGGKQMEKREIPSQGRFEKSHSGPSEAATFVPLTGGGQCACFICFL